MNIKNLKKSNMKKNQILYLFFIIGNALFSQNYSIEETTFKNDSLQLYADIFIPKNKLQNNKVGIVIIQGSGNSDRSNLWSRSFAEFLSENGYYILLPDKRGAGESEGSWKSSSFQDLADDVICSIEHFKNKYQIDKIGVMGLSQGGFIAPIVATQSNKVSFVIDIVGSSVTLEEQIIHEVSNTARKEGLSPNEIKEVLDLHILMKDYAYNRDWGPLGNRLKELETSSWSEFARTFPNSPDIWVWDWIKMNIDFNPIVYWRNVKQPVFVVYGSKDQEDNMPVYESVYRLQKAFHKSNNRNFEINVYETGHAMYEDDKAELRKEFLNGLLKWLKLNN